MQAALLQASKGRLRRSLTILVQT